MNKRTKRRTLLATGMAIAGGIASALSRRGNTSVTKVDTTKEIETVTSIPMGELGMTRERLPILGLGCGGHTPIARRGQQREGIALVERAIELGIRYFDTAANYGVSEEYLGKVLPAYRDRIFLCSKTARRDRDGAWRELERSLTRLNTDFLDLWQMHHVSFSEELETLFAADGAMKAVAEAKEQKLIRYTGITGHHEPDIIAEGLRRYPFDMTLIPINAADKQHPRPFIPTVLPVAQEKGVGVVAMKVPAYGRLLESGALDNMDRAFGYALSQPGVSSAIIAAESIQQLETNIAAARAFTPLDAEQLLALEAKVRDRWQQYSFYRAWT